MIQKGEFLEIMMGNLQAYLAPEGVDVKLREKFFSEETGKQVGEIDITVRGDFGTSRFFWGIECRDRPAEGPQGLPWIREIVGKKQQLGPDKMIAVSTTGFTKDAEQFAQSQNIDLITIENPTPDILLDWFEFLSFSYTDWKYETVEPVTLNLVDQENKPSEDALNFGLEAPIFTTPPFNMRPVSLDSLIKAKIQTELPNLDPDVGAIKLPIEIGPPLAVDLDGQTYPLRTVTTLVKLNPQTERVRALLNVCRRLSDNENIALTSTTRLKIKDQYFLLFIVVKKNITGEGSMSMKIHYYDEEGKEAAFPRGVSFGARYR